MSHVTKDRYRIARAGVSGFAVFEGDVRVSGILSCYSIAQDKLDALRRAAQRRTRRCLSCGKDFMSDGPGNRRCLPCKVRSAHEHDEIPASVPETWV